ncbi:MAG: HAD family hydrolase [Candidatus Curtissbacteria bacterium]|nr:HAD family hydrolase [Candidatus Curtissbacteria bacterium]
MAESERLQGNSIVFDWGNTLVLDPFDDLKNEVGQKAVEIAKGSFGFQLDENLFVESWSQANSNLNFQFASHFSQEEPFIQAGLHEANVPAEIRFLLGPLILAEYRKSFKELLENNPRKEELRVTLRGLRDRGKHLAVISNDRSFTPQSTLAWLGVADLFDHFLTSEEIGIEKPDPRVFEVASERFGRPISDIIYVGDDPIRDVECAHKAGAKAILYVPPEKYRSTKRWRDYSVSADKPDATVENFADLLTVIA